MPSSFQVEGTDQFLKLSKALKKAGQPERRKALIKGLQNGAKPLIPLTRQAAREKLPKKGGLNERMAKAPQRVRVRTGLKTAGVDIVLPGKQPGYTDGVIRRPVFERDKSSRKGRSARIKAGSGEKPTQWVEQRIDGTWFDDTIRDHADEVLPALEAAIEDIAQAVVRDFNG